MEGRGRWKERRRCDRRSLGPTQEEAVTSPPLALTPEGQAPSQAAEAASRSQRSLVSPEGTPVDTLILAPQR